MRLPFQVITSHEDATRNFEVLQTFLGGLPVFGVQITADGLTDNSTAIQTAVNAASTAGGGIVQLVPTGGGTVALGRFTLKSHVVVRGPGSRTLTLKAPSGSADVAAGLNFATLTGKSKATGDYLLGAPSSGVIGLTLDCNGTANYGFRVWGCGLVLDDVVVMNGAAGGIWTEFTDVDSFADPTQRLEASFGTVKSVKNAGDGWTMRGPHDSMCTDYACYSNTGWGLTVDAVAGSYTGGISFSHFNSFLNTLGSIRVLNGGFVDVMSGALSGSNTGTGLDLSATSGTTRIRAAVAGHNPGINLRGANHEIYITAATNNPGDVVQLNGCQKCRVQIGGGAGNTNVFNVVSEGGPNFFEGVIDIGGGATFQTGSAFNSQTTVIFSANGAGGTFSTVKLPAAALALSNGWTPTFGGSNGQVLTNDLITTQASIQAATATTGAAGAPPAQVVGYIKFTDSGGATRKIPYYAN